MVAFTRPEPSHARPLKPSPQTYWTGAVPVRLTDCLTPLTTISTDWVIVMSVHHISSTQPNPAPVPRKEWKEKRKTNSPCQPAVAFQRYEKLPAPTPSQTVSPFTLVSGPRVKVQCTSAPGVPEYLENTSCQTYPDTNSPPAEEPPEREMSQYPASKSVGGTCRGSKKFRKREKGMCILGHLF